MPRQIVFPAIAVMFFVSGFSALTLQTSWNTILSQSIGIDYFSTVVIISIFMLGLGLGGLLGGKLTRHYKRSIWLFFGAEATVSLFAIFSDTLIRSSQHIVLSVAGGDVGFYSLSINFAVYFLLLIGPVVLMGISLPIVVHFFRDRLSAGQASGVLYGVNILGAAIGCFITGFFLIGLYGLQNTIMIAAALNLLTILIVASVYRYSDPTPLAVDEHETSAKPFAASIIGFMFLLGFASLAYQILYFRVFVYYFGATTYVFPLILSAYLFHLGVGNFAAAQLLKRGKTARQILMVATLGALITTPFLFAAPTVFGVVAEWLQLNFRLSMLITTAVTMPKLVTTCLVAGLTLLPIMFLSMIFPVAIHVVTKQKTHLGRNVGSLYLYMTLGNFVGTLVTGIVLLMLFGTVNTALFLMGLTLLLPVFAERAGILTKKKAGHISSFSTLQIGSLIIIASYFLLMNSSFYNHITYKGKTPSFYQEELEGTAFIYDSYAKLDDGSTIYNGSRIQIGSEPATSFYGLDKNLPIWPMDAAVSILEREPERFLLIGIGTGDKALAIHKLYPDAKIVIVELLDVVIEQMQKRGSPFTKEMLKEADIYIMDGARFILSKQHDETIEPFDIIQIGVFHITSAGAGNLFTREFLEGLKPFLKEGGVVSTNAYVNSVKSGLDVFESTYLFGRGDGFNDVVYTNRPHKTPQEVKSDYLATRASMLHRVEALGLQDAFNTSIGVTKLLLTNDDIASEIRSFKPQTNDHVISGHFLVNKTAFMEVSSDPRLWPKFDKTITLITE